MILINPASSGYDCFPVGFGADSMCRSYVSVESVCASHYGFKISVACRGFGIVVQRIPRCIIPHHNPTSIAAAGCGAISGGVYEGVVACTCGDGKIVRRPVIPVPRSVLPLCGGSCCTVVREVEAERVAGIGAGVCLGVPHACGGVELTKAGGG